MAKYTPGPWTVFIPKTEVCWPCIKNADGKTFAEIGGFGTTREVNAATARLAAAAPELLTAIQALMDANRMGMPVIDKVVLEFCEKAIAKATGEE